MDEAFLDKVMKKRRAQGLLFGGLIYGSSVESLETAEKRRDCPGIFRSDYLLHAPEDRESKFSACRFTTGNSKVTVRFDLRFIAVSSSR